MDKLKQLTAKYLTGQTVKLLSLIGLLIVSGGLLVFLSFVNNKQQNLSPKKPKAAEITEFACDVVFNIARPTLTPTPTVFYPPTPTNTPTLTPTNTPTLTLTPTPTLTCKNLDIAIIIDRSGTMTEYESNGIQKLALAKEAAKTFVNAIINSNTTSVRVSVDSFGAQGNENDSILGNLTLSSEYKSTLDSPLTNDLLGVVTKIDNIKHIKNGTCVQCGLNIANKQLTSTVNRKVAILISDGLANHVWTGGEPGSTISKQVSVDQANDGRSKGIEYRVIGYRGKTSGIDEVTLKKIACVDYNNCPTSYYTYNPDANEWSKTFLTILNDLCQ